MHLRTTGRGAALGVALLAVIVLAAPPVTGQQPRPPERGADLLPLTFIAVSDDGRPVTDLRPDEVTVRLGGRVRPVRSLQFIAAEDEGAEPLPPPFGSNAISHGGRTLALIIDEDSFRPGREAPLREAVDALVAGLNPTDRVTLVTMPYSGTRVPLTTDHSRVRTAMSQLVGQAPASQTGSELACRSRRTLETLANYFDQLGVRQDPMTVMFVTSALAAPRRDAAFALAPGMCELSENVFAQVATAAGAARAQFYIIRPGDVSDGGAVQRETVRGSDNPLAGMDHLTGVTGGKLLSLTGSSGTAMERVLRETSAYYFVTLDAGEHDRSGRTQQLEVRVARRGVEVRSQPNVTFARPDPILAKYANPSIRDMVNTTIVFRDLPLRALAFPALGTENNEIRVVALAEPVDPQAKLESLAAVLVDQDNRVAGQWVATAEQLAERPVRGAMSVPAGIYRMRVAAIDATGRAGTADYDVTAEILRSGPLRLSSLVLGLSREGGFSPRLQFSNEPAAIGYVELEGPPSGTRVVATLELAKSMNGPSIVVVPLAISGAGGDRYVASGTLPLGAVPPGDYVARAVIGVEGQPVSRVVRTVRKTGR
jgi:hypothetical protein